jgi:hypothetical protein
MAKNDDRASPLNHHTLRKTEILIQKILIEYFFLLRFVSRSSIELLEYSSSSATLVELKTRKRKKETIVLVCFYINILISILFPQERIIIIKN